MTLPRLYLPIVRGLRAENEEFPAEDLPQHLDGFSVRCQIQRMPAQHTKIMKVAIAEIEGRIAFDAGKSRTDNPYPPEQALHVTWLSGWEALKNYRARQVAKTANLPDRRRGRDLFSTG